MYQKKEIEDSYAVGKVLVMRSIFGALHEVMSEGAFGKSVLLQMMILSIHDISRLLLRDSRLRQIEITCKGGGFISNTL